MSISFRFVCCAVRDVQGWCTWDAFYHDVSGLGLQQGLEGFRAADPARVPRWLIIDDGWQVKPAVQLEISLLSPPLLKTCCCGW
jgi:hypothetical protein